jgi:hypothetical protein
MPKRFPTNREYFGQICLRQQESGFRPLLP